MSNLLLASAFFGVLIAGISVYTLQKAKKSPKEVAPEYFKLGLHKYKFSDGQRYFVYVPKNYSDQKKYRLLSIIHGFTGNDHGAKGEATTLKNIKRWVDFADQNQYILLAPHYDEKIFNNDYQRLNLSGIRSDLRLNELVGLVGQSLKNVRTDKISLFGFSGGGQFVHRYCAFHPNKIDKAIIGASGWYMWPDEKLEYPLGLELKNILPDFKINLKALCKQKILLLVGEKDHKQGSFREEYKDVNLDILQGKNRINRAKNWFAQLKSYADQEQIPFSMTMKIIPKTGHEISNLMLEEAILFLLD